MASNSAIPKKYLRALVYYAAMFVAEWQERADAKIYFETEAEKRLHEAQIVDDPQLNELNTDSVGDLVANGDY